MEITNIVNTPKYIAVNPDGYMISDSVAYSREKCREWLEVMTYRPLDVLEKEGYQIIPIYVSYVQR
jgi:hypothetical protein